MTSEIQGVLPINTLTQIVGTDPDGNATITGAVLCNTNATACKYRVSIVNEGEAPTLHQYRVYDEDLFENTSVDLIKLMNGNPIVLKGNQALMVYVNIANVTYNVDTE